MSVANKRDRVLGERTDLGLEPSPSAALAFQGEGYLKRLALKRINQAGSNVNTSTDPWFIDQSSCFFSLKMPMARNFFKRPSRSS